MREVPKPYTPDELTALVLAARGLLLAECEKELGKQDKEFRSGTVRGVLFGRDITPELVAGLVARTVTRRFLPERQQEAD